MITKRFDWLVALYTFLYILGMTLYCYRELPVFDFRPYHIGADIRKGMEIPEGAQPTVYETRFILKKDGVEKEFSLENYPDSTWTFVDSKTVVRSRDMNRLFMIFPLFAKKTVRISLKKC